MEPIAGRIIAVPEDPVRARTRDPKLFSFISYVPVGSIAWARNWLRTGAADDGVRAVPAPVSI